jgi:hypothetical protein
MAPSAGTPLIAMPTRAPTPKFSSAPSSAPIVSVGPMKLSFRIACAPCEPTSCHVALALSQNDVP